MHAEARAFVAAQVAEHGPFRRVLEVGSRDINGGVRDLFGHCDYTGLDVVGGPGVDVVADVTAYRAKVHDCVVCCEVLEHADDAQRIVRALLRLCRKGGTVIITAATDPRAPHSAVDGAALRAGEHYANIDPGDLERWLAGCDRVDVQAGRGDVRAVAVK